MEQQQELPDELVGLILAFTDPSPLELCLYASLCRRWHRLVMAADSPGQTALALWSRLAHDRLWPDPSPTAIRNTERSGGPDLWRRLQVYRRWRDQRRVLESRGGPDPVLPYDRCEEANVCASKVTFTRSLIDDWTFAECKRNVDRPGPGYLKWALTEPGHKARQLVREYVNSYTLIDNLAVCQDDGGGAWGIYDIDLSDDELAVAKAEHHRQLREGALPESNSTESAKLLHTIESCTEIQEMRPHHESGRVFGLHDRNISVVDARQGQMLCEALLPEGEYQEMGLLRLDGNLLAFKAMRSGTCAAEVWDINEPSKAAIYRTRPVSSLYNLHMHRRRELWGIGSIGSVSSLTMYDMRSPYPVCTVDSDDDGSLFVNDEFIALGNSSRVQVYDRRNLSNPVLTHEQHSYLVTDVALTSDSKKAVSCAWDGNLIVADVGTGESMSVNLSAKLGQMQLITDRIVAVTDVMSVVSLIDIETMELLRAYEVTSNGCGNNCTFVINETKLGAGMGNGPVAGHFVVFDLALDTGGEPVYRELLLN